MGMLFNTDATLKLLEIANIAFNKLNYAQNIQTNPTYSKVLQMQSPYTTISTYKNLAKPLGVDHEEVGKSKRWQKWLNYFDADIASTVYGYIYNGAILNANVVQVEFFAVPSNTKTLAASSILVVDNQSDGSDGSKSTLAITISTNTIDQLISLRPLSGRRPGVRKKNK
jgi:hypothetical protein